ncbi:MAG: 30S ribosomal protein S16 [Tissierellia bacterium]|nr:30S ribosomal protein S16 [Tissierellia bacterium]
MAVKIRLRRMGSKKSPFYRVIVADSRAPRNGRFIEEIGVYNPLTEPKTFKVDQEKAVDWLNKGAKPTDTVARLFKQAGVANVAESKVEEAEVVAETEVEQA